MANPSPFAAPSAAAPSSMKNPFGPTSTSTTATPSAPFGVPSKTPFGRPLQKAFASGPFSKSSETTAPAVQNPFGTPSAPSLSQNQQQQKQQQRPGSSGFGAPSQPNGFKNNITTQPPRQKTPQSQPPSQSQQKPRHMTSEYGKAIYAQLKKDGIQRPHWPKNPGSPSQRVAMDDMMQSYKKYRENARKSLIKARLIDDPDKQKTLAEAIDFKGICEDMCPEWEKIKRIVQHDVKQAEKTNGDPDPNLMIKALARSAAGQEAPLPMDVLSIASCRRTIDFLLDEVLRSDNNLSTVHGFLWDRTRAVRRDFVFHSSTTDEEKLDQIYCLETVVRFHVVALHLMSQKGYAGEDYSEKQEIEQLSKSLLSLQEIYKQCRKEKRIVPPNEAEFIAYSILLYARDPSGLSRVYLWGKKMFDTSKEVRTAIAIVEAIQNTWDDQGPEIGRPSDSMMPFETALPGYTMMFSLLEDPDVSYTMACFAEILFGWVRQSMLKTIHTAFWRPRTMVKDFTVKRLRKMFRFDTEEELVEFVEQHGIEFGTNDDGEMFMILIQKGNFDLPKIYQSFSRGLVEKKRGNKPITQAIREPVYQDASSTPIDEMDAESIFVSDKQPTFEAPAPMPPPAPSPTPKPSPFASLQSPKATSQHALASAFLPASAPMNSVFTPKPQPPPVDNAFPAPAAVESQEQPPKDPFRLLNGPPSFLSQSPNGEQHSMFQPPKGPIKLQTTTAVPSPPVLSDSTPSDPPPTKYTAAFSPVPAMPTAPASFTAPRGSGVGGNSMIFGPGTKVTPPTPAQKDGSVPSSSFFPPGSLSATDGGNAASQAPSKPVFAPSFPLAAEPSANHGTPPQGKLAGLSSPSTQTITQAPAPAPARSQARRTEAPANPLFRPFIPLGQKVEPVDKMKGFTKWIVTGDDGLMDQFLEVEVERLLQETWDQYHADIEEAERREKEARDLAIAKKFRDNRLAVKYGCLWYNIVSRQASRRRGRENRAKVQAWREQKIARDREVRLAAEKKARQPKIDKFDAFKKVVSSHQRAIDDRALETALLGTGLLAGVHDAELSAKRLATDTHWEKASNASGPTQSDSSAKRLKVNGTSGGFASSLSQLRHGLSPVADDTASVTSGISSILSQPHRSRGKTARVLESLRQSGGLGESFRRSLPPMSFSRSLSGSTVSQEPTRQSAVPDAYWMYKIHGHVLMPNGQMLPEKIATSINKGAKYPKLYGPHGSMSPPSTKRQRSVSVAADSPDMTATKVKKHRVTASLNEGEDEERRARLERVRQNDPDTYALIMSTRETNALLDDATGFLREINRTENDGFFASEGI